ncbi:MAG: sugar phosphate nucleotidyltransferase [Janthinobacterium lividum]
MWGIVPAAGTGTRIQPLAFSKELLPVGSRIDKHGVERPRAVSEHLVERMLLAGVTRLCFVISPWKSDILQYYGGAVGGVPVAYVIQNQAAGLCDAIFCAMPLIAGHEAVVIGLPDTVWFPADALRALPADGLAFLLFPVARPELFDAVVTDDAGRVQRIEVKHAVPSTDRVWGAMRMPGHVLHALHALWLRRERRDEFLGTLVNAWLEEGGAAVGVCAGESYVDVGTFNGYREAMRLLSDG